MKLLPLISAVLMVTVSIVQAVGQEPSADPISTAAQVRHSTGTATVVSRDPRPLWMAMNALEREYGWLLDYEDPLYEKDNESVSRPNPHWERLHPGVASRVPAGSSLTSTYPEDAETVTSPSKRRAIISKLLNDCNASSNPGRFELRIAASGRLNIVGYSRSTVGTQTAILDTPLTLPVGPTGSIKALQELTEALSEKSGVKVVLGVVPWNLLARAQISIQAGPTPARATLTDIADSPTVQLMWDFLYDFDSHSYFLSLRPRSKVVTDVMGNQVLLPH